MNDEQPPPASLHTYLLIGFGTPVLPSFMCFLFFAAASFSSNPLPRVLLLTMLTIIVGGCISWLAYRRQNSLGATALAALLAPWIGFLLGVLIEEGIEHVLAGWGWLTIYDSYGYRIPLQPTSIWPILFGITLSIALILSIGIGSGMLATARWASYLWQQQRARRTNKHG